MYYRLFLISVLAAGFACAQGPGGGESGSRMGGGGDSNVPMTPRAMPSPLDRMTRACSLSKDQTKQFESILSAASKTAAPVREQIGANRKQLDAAVLAGKSPDEVKKLTEASGLAMAQMTQIEMKAFGDLYKLLSPDQRHSGAQVVYSSLTGMFLRKSWNE